MSVLTLGTCYTPGKEYKHKNYYIKKQRQKLINHHLIEEENDKQQVQVDVCE